jgi:hypothetical protein
MDKQDKHSIYSRMEDVDRSCVHVVIVIGVVLALLAYIIYPSGIGGISFTELTPGAVLRLTGAVVLGLSAILIFIDVLDVFIKR